MRVACVSLSRGAVFLGAMGVLAGLAMTPRSVMAADARPNILDQEQTSSILAHKMMGHINLATLALDSKLPEEALGQVKKAEKLASELIDLASEETSRSLFKYGKLSYTQEGRAKHYYVPVLDDKYLLNDYNVTHRAFSEAGLEEVDAGVVEVTISLDLRDVEEALAKAEKKMIAHEYVAARLALGQVFDDSVSDEHVVSDPVWAIHDNLALAQNLVRGEQYESARLTLEHAKRRLEELAKKPEASSAKKQEFSMMHAEITQLQSELRKQDPTITERILDRFSAWMSALGSWSTLGQVEI